MSPAYNSPEKCKNVESDLVSNSESCTTTNLNTMCVLPNGRQLLGSPMPMPSENNSCKRQAPESKLTQSWFQTKKLIKGYSRRERRFLRFQAVRDFRMQRSRKYSGGYQQPSLSLEKGTQTDTAVTMFSPLPLKMTASLPTEYAEPGDDRKIVIYNNNNNNNNNNISRDGKKTPTILSSLLTSRSPIKKSSYAHETLSPSLLPPITPCLKRACPFVEEMKNEANPVWLGCSYVNEVNGIACPFWVHARCHGFPNMTQRVVRLTKGFRCPKHLV